MKLNKISAILGAAFLQIFVFHTDAQANRFGVMPVSPPKVAPAFDLSDLQGKPIRLEDLKGKVVLLNFWASWCGPCIEEIPSFIKMFESYRNKDLVLVGVSVDSGEGALLSAVKRFGINFPVVWDRDGKLAAKYGARSLPTTVFIDREGKITGLVRGARNWDSPEAHETLGELLKKPADLQKVENSKPQSSKSAESIPENHTAARMQVIPPASNVKPEKAFVVQVRVSWPKSAPNMDFEPPEADLPEGVQLVTLGSTAYQKGDQNILDFDLYLVANDKAATPLKIGPISARYEASSGEGYLKAPAVSVNVDRGGWLNKIWRSS